MLRNVEAAARLAGVKVYVSVYHPGSRTTPLEPDGAGRVRALHRGARDRDPELRRHHRRQRAEPEPLLAAAVRAQRRERVGARVPPAPRPDLRRAQGRRPEAPRLGRRARAARLRPPGRDPPDLVADRVHPGDGRRLPRERPHDAGDGRVRDAPVPGQLLHEPDTANPRNTSIGLADYDKLVGLLGRAFDGTAQLGSTLPIIYDEFGIESIVPDGKRQPLLRERADDDEAGRRVEAGRGLRPRPQARLLPAERRRDPALPLARRGGAARAGSRASTTPTARRRRACPPSATRSTARAGARSRSATGSRSTSG